LARACFRGGNSLFARAHGEAQVPAIDAHERLAALHGLPGIDQPFEHLAGDAESEVALHASRDDSAERTLYLRGDLDRFCPY
jgi:hypothetical protein